MSPFRGATSSILLHSFLFQGGSILENLKILLIYRHTRADTSEARGKALADQAAKEAAVKEERVQSDQIMITQEDLEQEEITWDLLKQIQKQATPQEKLDWLKESAQEEKESGLWTQGERASLPKALYPLIASIAHGPTHQSKTIMKELIDNGPRDNPCPGEAYSVLPHLCAVQPGKT